MERYMGKDPAAYLIILHVSAHRPVLPPGNTEADSKDQGPYPCTISELTVWVHKHSGHHSETQQRELHAPPYIDILAAVSKCLIFSLLRLRKVSQTTGCNHCATQPVLDWRTDYKGPLLMSQRKKYTLTCVDTTTGLMQDFCKRANQNVTINGLEQLHVIYRYP